MCFQFFMASLFLSVLNKLIESQNLSSFSWSAIMTVAGNSKGVDVKYVGLFQKNKSEFSPSFFLFSRANCYFLTVLQSVAQSVFNASQGVRDLGLLSWTPLTVFPPQVSCVREEKQKHYCYIADFVISKPFVSLPSLLQPLLKHTYALELQLHG